MSKFANPRLDTFRQSPIRPLPVTWPEGWMKGEEGYQMIALEHGSHIVSHLKSSRPAHPINPMPDNLADYTDRARSSRGDAACDWPDGIETQGCGGCIIPDI